MPSAVAKIQKPSPRALVVLIIVLAVLLVLVDHKTSSFNNKHTLRSSIPPLEKRECALPNDAAQQDYSITIIAPEDHATVSNTIADLFAKHKGIVGNSSKADQVNYDYNNDGSIKPSTRHVITSYYLSGTMSIKEAGTFMSALKAILPEDASIESENFSQTDRDQLSQNCFASREHINSLRQSEVIYLSALRQVLRDPAATSSLEILNNLQGLYSNATADRAAVWDIQRRLNKTSVSITVNDSPMNYSAPVGVTSEDELEEEE